MELNELFCNFGINHNFSVGVVYASEIGSICNSNEEAKPKIYLVPA